MAISVIIDGTTYSVPELGERNWGQNTTDLLEALGNAAYLIKGGNIPLSAEAVFITYGLRAPWFASTGANASSTGAVRLANLDAVNWRNAADSADLTLTVNGSDKLTFDSSEVLDTDNTATVTNKTIDADNNTITNLAHGAEVDNPSSGVHGVTGNVVGTTDSQTLANKTVDNTNTINTLDTALTIQDEGDNTKQARFQASGITTATTRTFTFQDADGTIAHEEDLVTAEGESADIRTTQGTAFGATDLGTFTGTTITDNVSVKTALQELETQAESNSDHTNLSNIGTNTHAQIDTHIASTANPHSVTATQVGLGNVDNTSDATKNSAAVTLENKTVSDLIYQFADDATDTADIELTPTKIATRMTGLTADRNLTSMVNTNTGVAIVVNDTAFKLTVINEDTGVATAANRILTGTGRDLIVVAGASISLVYDSTESRWRVIGGAGSGGLSLENISGAATAEPSLHYMTDTSGGAFTITLPVGSEGSVMRFTDATESWGTNPLTIAPATGEAIDGQAANETLVLDVTGTWVQFMWDSSASQWVTDDIFAAYGDTSLAGTSGKNYVLNPDAAVNTDDVTGDTGFSVTRTTTAAQLAEESKATGFLISGTGLTAGTSKVAWGITATGIDDADGGVFGRAVCRVLDVSGSINGEYEVQVYNVTDSVYVGDSETITGTGTYYLDVPLVAGNDYEFHLRAATGSTTWSNIGISGVTIEPVSQTWASLGGWKQYSEAGGDFTVTATSWTTERAVAVPYKDPVTDIWRLQFNFVMDRGSEQSISAVDFTVSGVTFKNQADFDQACAIVARGTGLTNIRSGFYGFAQDNTSTVSVNGAASAAIRYISVSGDVELDSKPTWADWDNTAPTASDVQYENARGRWYRNSALSYTLNTTFAFDTEDTTTYDTAVGISNSSGVFTVTAAGTYDITVGLGANPAWATNTQLELHVDRAGGGATQERIMNRPGSSDFQLSGNTSVKLAAGDTFEIRTNDSATVITGSATTFIEVERRGDYSARKASLPFSDNGTADGTKQYYLMEYRKTTVSLVNSGASNINGDIVFVKIGDVVTFSSTASLTHSSSSFLSSASGEIPADFRPSDTIDNTYLYDNGSGKNIRMQADGTITLSYQDETGGVNRTNSDGVISGSYVIT